MKRYVIATVLILCAVAAYAQEQKKLYVHQEYNKDGDTVLFIQDLETGTRCYGMTNSRSDVSGYAISCVPKKQTRRNYGIYSDAKDCPTQSRLHRHRED